MGAADMLKNQAQSLKGTAKETFGDATDDESTQAEGQRDKTAGNLKQAGEKVKDAFNK